MQLSTLLIALSLVSVVLSGECTENHCISCRQKTGTIGDTGNYCAECNERSLSGAAEDTKCEGTISIRDCIRVKYKPGTTTQLCSLCKFGKMLDEASNSCVTGPVDCVVAVRRPSGTECFGCPKGKRITLDGSACEDLGTDTEDPKCKNNGKSNGNGKVKCVRCDAGYYILNDVCLKRPEGSDLACLGLDAGNTDNKCTAARGGCNAWEGWFSTKFDGTYEYCTKNSQILSALFALVSLISLILKL